MDPVTEVGVELKLQQALTAYRTRADEDVLLAQKATNTRVSSLEARADTSDALIATKAASSDVYTRDLTDQRIGAAVQVANSSSRDATEALAQSLSSAVQTLNQNLSNAQSTLTSQINAKVSTDAWPGLVLAAKTEVTSAASAAATVAASAAMASKAPLQAPSFTGPVLVDGQEVVLTNDPRMSLRGPTGPAGVQGPPGATGPQGAQGFTGPAGLAGPEGSQGATGPQGVAGAVGLTGPTGSQGAAGSGGATGPTGAQGTAGPTGSQGVAGPTGPQGAAGAGASVSPYSIVYCPAPVTSNLRCFCFPGTYDASTPGVWKDASGNNNNVVVPSTNFQWHFNGAFVKQDSTQNTMYVQGSALIAAVKTVVIALSVPNGYGDNLNLIDTDYIQQTYVSLSGSTPYTDLGGLFSAVTFSTSGASLRSNTLNLIHITGVNYAAFGTYQKLYFGGYTIPTTHSWPANSRCAAIALYDRSLSAAEIDQNNKWFEHYLTKFTY